ncbi:MucR family transcriptional regulator [Methylobacterium sp. J-090]|nr:MucR family transcriptional regulator [Methylobacterium sp. J-090]
MAKGRGEVELAADIVSAYVSNNSALPAEIPDILALVHAAVVGLGRGGTIREPTATAIRELVTREALISLGDGKPNKMLRRRITALGLTPEACRSKWGLPRDYPIVAASHSAERSASAKMLGLGQPRRTGAPKLFVVASNTPDTSEHAGTSGMFPATGTPPVPGQTATK